MSGTEKTPEERVEELPSVLGDQLANIRDGVFNFLTGKLEDFASNFSKTTDTISELATKVQTKLDDEMKRTVSEMESTINGAIQQIRREREDMDTKLNECKEIVEDRNKLSFTNDKLRKKISALEKENEELKNRLAELSSGGTTRPVTSPPPASPVPSPPDFPIPGSTPSPTPPPGGRKPQFPSPSPSPSGGGGGHTPSSTRGPPWGIGEDTIVLWNIMDKLESVAKYSMEKLGEPNRKPCGECLRFMIVGLYNFVGQEVGDPEFVAGRTVIPDPPSCSCDSAKIFALKRAKLRLEKKLGELTIANEDEENREEENNDDQLDYDEENGDDKSKCY